MQIILGTTKDGIKGGCWGNQPPGTDNGKMYVDYVRMYQKNL